MLLRVVAGEGKVGCRVMFCGWGCHQDLSPSLLGLPHLLLGLIALFPEPWGVTSGGASDTPGSPAPQTLTHWSYPSRIHHQGGPGPRLLPLVSAARAQRSRRPPSPVCQPRATQAPSASRERRDGKGRGKKESRKRGAGKRGDSLWMFAGL